MSKFISYSQHADDYIAWQLLGKKRKGMIIEVGAFDGKHLSNSFSLEALGWDSMCIEPNPDIFFYLQKNRPRAKNINVAVVSDESTKEIKFFSEKLGVLSGCSYDEEDIKSRYHNRGLTYEKPVEMSVPALTLNKIIQDNKLNEKSIDIISIDVEGFEMEVLKGIDLNKYRPGLFIIEANNDVEKEKIIAYFIKYSSYIYIGSNWQNLFFLKKKFSAPYILRNVDLINFTPAKQQHPVNDQFALQAIAPNFVKSDTCLDYQKYFGLF